MYVGFKIYTSFKLSSLLKVFHSCSQNLNLPVIELHSLRVAKTNPPEALSVSEAIDTLLIQF